MTRRRQRTPRKYTRPELVDLGDRHDTESSCTFDFASIDYPNYYPFFHGLPSLVVKTAATLHFTSSAGSDSDSRAPEGTIAAQQPKFADYLIKVLSRKLPESRCLTTLILSNLTIPEAYFKQFIDACGHRNTKRLKNLELKQISISLTSATHLFAKLSPYRLESLKVVDCQLAETSYDHVIAFLDKQPSAGDGEWALRDLVLEGNEFQQDTLQEISDLVGSHWERSLDQVPQEEESSHEPLDEGPAEPADSLPDEPLSDGDVPVEPEPEPEPDEPEPLEDAEPVQGGNEEEEQAEPAPDQEPEPEAEPEPEPEAEPEPGQGDSENVGDSGRSSPEKKASEEEEEEEAAKEEEKEKPPEVDEEPIVDDDLANQQDSGLGASGDQLGDSQGQPVSVSGEDQQAAAADQEEPLSGDQSPKGQGSDGLAEDDGPPAEKPLPDDDFAADEEPEEPAPKSEEGLSNEPQELGQSGTTGEEGSAVFGTSDGPTDSPAIEANASQPLVIEANDDDEVVNASGAED
jgi:hypothetical protein